MKSLKMYSNRAIFIQNRSTNQSTEILFIQLTLQDQRLSQAAIIFTLTLKNVIIIFVKLIRPIRVNLPVEHTRHFFRRKNKILRLQLTKIDKNDPGTTQEVFTRPLKTNLEQIGQS